jgi:hypothetical protein
MKTLQQMLRELARPGVSELAVASDRLPCVKVGDKYEPIDDVARGTDAILEMLVAAGGGRHMADLEGHPAQWTLRVDGLGLLTVQAALRGGRAQARITVAQRAAQAPPPAAVAAPRVEPVRDRVRETAPDPVPLLLPSKGGASPSTFPCERPETRTRVTCTSSRVGPCCCAWRASSLLEGRPSARRRSRRC